MDNKLRIQTVERDGGRLLINAAFGDLLAYNRITSAEALWNTEGVSVKNAVQTRGTSRVFLKNPDGGPDVECYIKRYLTPSIKDRIKCALSFKPVFSTGALHEWGILCRFHELGLNTMIPMAAADRGQRRTCNLTLGITGYVRASDLFAGELRAYPERRRRMIEKIAALLGNMHANGLAHQDFYLVHLFVKPDENDAVYLIDLQRTIMQKKLSRRWRIKDLAQIHFALSPLISGEEIALFRKRYGEISPANARIWKAVDAKANRIRRHTAKHRL